VAADEENRSSGNGCLILLILLMALLVLLVLWAKSLPDNFF
jgi:hypothetical protein